MYFILHLIIAWNWFNTFRINNTPRCYGLKYKKVNNYFVAIYQLEILSNLIFRNFLSNQHKRVGGNLISGHLWERLNMISKKAFAIKCEGFVYFVLQWSTFLFNLLISIQLSSSTYYSLSLSVVYYIVCEEKPLVY